MNWFSETKFLLTITPVHPVSLNTLTSLPFTVPTAVGNLDRGKWQVPFLSWWGNSSLEECGAFNLVWYSLLQGMSSAKWTLLTLATCLPVCAFLILQKLTWCLVTLLSGCTPLSTPLILPSYFSQLFLYLFELSPLYWGLTMATSTFVVAFWSGLYQHSCVEWALPQILVYAPNPYSYMR